MAEKNPERKAPSPLETKPNDRDRDAFARKVGERAIKGDPKRR